MALDIGDTHLGRARAAHDGARARRSPAATRSSRARSSCSRSAAAREHGFAVELDKRIPVGAGLGGGSSDAGVALRLANGLLERPLDAAALLAVAAEVGSDVPFFAPAIRSPSCAAAASGCGPLRLHAAPVVALAWPGDTVSTADVYRAYRSAWSERGVRARGRGRRASPRGATCARSRASSRTTSAAPGEALCPASAALRRELRRRGALAACLSGSGSAVFGLFASAQAAETAVADLPGAAWSGVGGCSARLRSRS